MKEKEKKRKEEAAQLGASTSIEIPTQPAHIHTGMDTSIACQIQITRMKNWERFSSLSKKHQ